MEKSAPLSLHRLAAKASEWLLGVLGVRFSLGYAQKHGLGGILSLPEVPLESQAFGYENHSPVL